MRFQISFAVPSLVSVPLVQRLENEHKDRSDIRGLQARVQHLQRQQIVGTDDARRAEVGHDGGREADALEPLGDDAHFGIVWLTKNK